MAVDKAHAGFDCSGHAVRFAQVLGPNVTAQTVFDVVGFFNGVRFVLEGDQAGDGAKDFFLGDAHAVVDVGKHGGPDEVAVLHMRGQVGGVAGLTQSATQHRRALFGAEFDVAAYLGQVGFADHRAYDGFLVKRVAHGDAFGALGKLGCKVGVDALLHQDAATCGAALAVVAEDHEDGGIQRAVQVGVFKDHKGALAAQFHAELLEARALHDAVAGDGGAGEADGPHIAVRHQRLARLFAVAVHQIQHACGHTSFECQLTQTCGAQGGEFAHLEHGGVAKGETRRDLPGGGHEGHVPRADERANAHWVEQGVVQVRGRGVGVPVNAGAHLGKVVEVVGRARHQLFAGLADGLAAVPGFGF